MKKSTRFLAAVTGAAMLCSSALPPVSADDTVLLGPADGMINIVVTDANGTPIEGAKMELVNPDESTPPAVWDSGSPENAVYNVDSYAPTAPFQYQFKPSDWPNINETAKSLRMWTADGTEVGTAARLGFLSLSGGESYRAEIQYLPTDAPAEMTVPANQMLLNVDAAWADKVCKGGMVMQETEEQIYFNERAGTEELFAIPAGEYSLFTRLEAGSRGCGGSGGHITISDKETTYVKRTFRLHDATSYYNPDGTYTSSEGVIHDFTHDNVELGRYAVVYLISGSVVNAVLPDSEGYVTAYLDSTTFRFQHSTNFMSEKWSGGGINGGGGSVYQTIAFDHVKTQAAPDDGFTFIYPSGKGCYVHQLQAPAGYLPIENTYIATTPGEKLQRLQLINDKIGDVNRSCSVDLLDAILVMRNYATMLLGGEPTLTQRQRRVGDVNNDYWCDLFDATAILKQYATSLLDGKE